MREKYLGFKAMCNIYIHTYTQQYIRVYIPARLIKAKEICIYSVQGARWEKVK